MNILAVDDERLVLDALVAELKEIFKNEDIRAERSSPAAISYANELKENGKELDYAFLDIHLGSKSGLELAKTLKTMFPKTVLIFCTAFSEYAFDAFGLCAKGYLTKPIEAEKIIRVLDEMVTDWRKNACESEKILSVRTFGHFEVFSGGKSVSFEREKAKELFAYLVDRHGSSVTTEQIAAVLWEDVPYDRKLKNMVTSIVSSMRTTLKNAGAEDVIAKSWNHIAIDPEKIKCDAYDFEKMDAVAINSFHGEYMTNYSWAEFTTGKYAAETAE